jgi:WD40 repeat protein
MVPTSLTQVREYIRLLPGMHRYDVSPPEVIVWNLATGRPRLVLSGQSRPVLSPDGTRLATTDRDGTIRIWDISEKSATRRVAPRP